MAREIYVGVDGGIARRVGKPYAGIDGIARSIISGYVGVEGVARQCFKKLRIIPVSYNNRPGATITIDTSGTYPYIAVSGSSSGTGWCGAILIVDGIKAGTPVTFRFEASKENGSTYADYIVRFNDTAGTLKQWANTNPGRTTYTPSRDCVLEFHAEIGGTTAYRSTSLRVLELTVGSTKLV